MPKQYVLKLTAEERAKLQHVVRKGRVAGWKVQRAQALLQCDQGSDGPAWTDEQIAAAYGVTTRSLESWRKQAVARGPPSLPQESLLERKPRLTPAVTPKLDGEKQARLTALACSKPPDGHVRWSLRLLAERLVELEVVESVSYETVRRAMKKNELKPWLKTMWCIPPHASIPQQDAAFVCQMEQVLEVYKRPYDPKRPVVGMDEQPKQLIAETRPPLPAAPGCPKRVDYEYVREGVCVVWMFVEPLAVLRYLRRRDVRVTDTKPVLR